MNKQIKKGVGGDYGAQFQSHLCYSWHNRADFPVQWQVCLSLRPNSKAGFLNFSFYPEYVKTSIQSFIRKKNQHFV